MTAVSGIKLSNSSLASTIEIKALNELGEELSVQISGERPLTVYFDKRELITLMTLGQNPEALVLGWLLNQRFISSISEIEAIQVDWETESAAVTSKSLSKSEINFWETKDLSLKMSKRTTTTGCGQGTVFGDLMESIDQITLPKTQGLHEETVFKIMEYTRSQDSIYKQAGAVHGCALCSNRADNRGEILFFTEDVGRHNAVDTLAGLMHLHGLTGEDLVFYTTGRLTSEMVIKCAQMGIPNLVSRSGLTQMGYEIANRLGLTMLGRCRNRHYHVYTGREHFIQSNLSEMA